LHDEIGWRLIRKAWGNGYATEAARAALIDVFRRVKLLEVLAYTAPDNLRSQAVMKRLQLKRDASRDFIICSNRVGTWQGLVWRAQSDFLASAGRRLTMRAADRRLAVLASRPPTANVRQPGTI